MYFECYFYICFRDEILENSKAGASPDATKVVVLITDGDPSDSDRSGIIKKYDEKNIIRFVIGVSCDVITEQSMYLAKTITQ